MLPLVSETHNGSPLHCAFEPVFSESTALPWSGFLVPSHPSLQCAHARSPRTHWPHRPHSASGPGLLSAKALHFRSARATAPLGVSLHRPLHSPSLLQSHPSGRSALTHGCCYRPPPANFRIPDFALFFFFFFKEITFLTC